MSVRVWMIFVAHVQLDRMPAQVRRVQMPHAQLRAEARRLLLHVLDELGALYALRPAGKVLHQRGDGELAAGLMAFQHQRLQVGARAVDGGGKSGAAGAQDDDVACGGGGVFRI